MADLTRITGAAKGTIFHHFKNKEDLFLNVLDNARQTIVHAFAAHTEKAGYKNGIRMVEGVITFYLTLSREHEDLFLLLHRHYPYQMAETSPECRRLLESVYTCLLDMFEQGVATGLSDGSVSAVSPRNTAMLLFAMVDGVARLNTYRLYEAGSLYSDLMASCRQILTPGKADMEAV